MNFFVIEKKLVFISVREIWFLFLNIYNEKYVDLTSFLVLIYYYACLFGAYFFGLIYMNVVKELV